VKASIIFMGMQIMTLYTVLGYFEIIAGMEIISSGNRLQKIIIYLIIIFIPNEIYFSKKGPWRKYINGFESWSARRQMISKLLLALIVVSILIGFAIMVTLRKQARSQGLS
jgi:hypothetical protein